MWVECTDGTLANLEMSSGLMVRRLATPIVSGNGQGGEYQLLASTLGATWLIAAGKEIEMRELLSWIGSELRSPRCPVISASEFLLTRSESDS